MRNNRLIINILTILTISTLINSSYGQKQGWNAHSEGARLLTKSELRKNPTQKNDRFDDQFLRINAMREARIRRLLKLDAHITKGNRKLGVFRPHKTQETHYKKVNKKHAEGEAVDDGMDSYGDPDLEDNTPKKKRKGSIIILFIKKYFRMIIFIAVLVAHFLIVYPYFFGNFWVPFWQAKANSYQMMPMYRLAGIEVSASEEDLWDILKVTQKCREFELLHNEDYSVDRLINMQFHEFLFSCTNKKSLEVEDISSTYSTLFLPLVLTQNKKRKDKNPWYYFEVELTYLDPKLDFGIGLFEKPDKDNQDATEYVAHIAARKELGQTNKAKLGYYENSIGFYIKSGSLMISGSNDYIFDIYDIYQKMHNPKRMFEANKSDAEENKLDDDEIYDFAGDTVGMAYNSETGHVFITINGEIINKADPKVTTEINYQIMQRHDKEDREYEHEEVMNKINKDVTAYIKNLDLDKEYTDMMREVVEIKMTPGIEYIPAIMSGGETEFNLNIGRTTFRNVQPEFASGLLCPYDEKKRHAYMTRKPFTDEQLKERKLDKEYDGDSFQADSDGISLEYENMT